MGIVGFTPWYPVMEAETFAQRLQRAVANIRSMDAPVDPAPVDSEVGVLHLPEASRRAQLLEWLGKQTESVRKVYWKAPGDRLYRVRVPQKLQEGLGRRTLIVMPVGWGHKRGAPRVACWVLNGPRDAWVGSQREPMVLPPDALEDVTEACLDGTLEELFEGRRRR